MSTYLLSVVLMILAALFAGWVSLAISRRSHAGFFRLLENHLPASKSKLLVYNVRKDKFHDTSDEKSSYNGISLSLFAFVLLA